jgi:hypothetical protein
MDKPAVCIATIRPEQFKEWLAAWHEEFKREGVRVFVMFDGDDVEDFISLDKKQNEVPREIFSHPLVAKELGNKSWIIPKKTSACKSFAIYKAWKAGCDPIMVLDDDCLPWEPEDSWVKTHKKRLAQNCNVHHVWPTLTSIPARGTPHMPSMPIALSHGLWRENLDLDAIWGLITEKPVGLFTEGAPPTGCLFPMSGMNIAFRREIAPLMYFGLQGPDWGVDRFDDIWCGFLAKKVLDHCGYAVWSGSPSVRHVKASDPFVNIVKEAPGYKMNVELYEWVRDLNLVGWDTDPKRVLEEIARTLERSPFQGEYWASYGKAILAWLELFQPEEAFGI